MLQEIFYAQTGEIIDGNTNAILRTSAIGSCIVVVAYSKLKKTGVMAHIMLPGKAPNKKDIERFKYANNAIDEVITRMRIFDAPEEDNEFCLVGGGNVLRRENDTIAQKNIDSVLEYFEKRNLKIVAKSLGGMERRSVSLDLATGKVVYTIGDSSEKKLYDYI